MESRRFWKHWKTPCLFSCWSWMACACPWELGHSPGSTANGVDTCLVWLWVKFSAWSDAGEMNVHQADLITSTPAIVFVRTLVSAPQPAPIIFQLPWSCWHSSGGAAPPAQIRSFTHLAPFSCFQTATRQDAGNPHGGQLSPRGGGQPLLLLALHCVMGSLGGHEANANAEGWSLWVSLVPGAYSCHLL